MVKVHPDSRALCVVQVPETLVEQVTKDRFASMLADMRERGSSDEQLKELITQV